tara:strand:+ start:34895 stop:35809 length:915 start_codon:yes stop_codon:yes gene_type:complete
MEIAIVLNPRSGRGKAQKASEALCAGLEGRGHRVVLCQTGEDHAEIESAIAGADRVVVVGGDGTVHHLLGVFMRAGVPMYHMGTGTANLICKEFGMSRSPRRVIEHLEQGGEPTLVDVPECNGSPFLIMVSLGIDASVIHRFEESRNHSGGYRAYVQPIVREVFSPRSASYTISTDADDAQPPYSDRGILVVSNMRSYGGAFNPSPRALANDGLLDAVSVRCRSSIGGGLQYGVLRMRLSLPTMRRFVSESFVIRCDEGAACVQLDGERAMHVGGMSDGVLGPGQVLEVRMVGQKLAVHAPLRR